METVAGSEETPPECLPWHVDTSDSHLGPNAAGGDLEEGPEPDAVVRSVSAQPTAEAAARVKGRALAGGRSRKSKSLSATDHVKEGGWIGFDTTEWLAETGTRLPTPAGGRNRHASPEHVVPFKLPTRKRKRSYKNIQPLDVSVHEEDQDDEEIDSSDGEADGMLSIKKR